MESTNDKPMGFEFWRTKLKSARYVVAPMVDQSELAWRMLSRRYGAELCYTPMLHASVFIRDANYRRESLTTCEEDRPLVVQFCANDSETLLKAAKYVEGMCEAVDLNLGCPQSIAKRGHYGAFLQDEWDLLYDMVQKCAEKLSVPITCKIRVFEDIDKSIKYAQMLEKAGAQLLTVHGRTRDQKGAITGIASWKHITAIRRNVNIPVFANGNIQYLEDVHRCLQVTGTQGVMTAEGNLHNPALFTGQLLPAYQMAEEYLQLVEKYPCPMSFIRGHMFKLLHHILFFHPDYRDALGNCKTPAEIQSVVARIREACAGDVADHVRDPTCFKASELNHPYWLCQPYERPDPTQPQTEEQLLRRATIKRPLESSNAGGDQTLSKNKLKKLRRNCNKSFAPSDNKFDICGCLNPKGLKCVFELCRSCCRSKAYKTLSDCPGHKIYMRKQREEAELRAKLSSDSANCSVQPDSTQTTFDTTNCFIDPDNSSNLDSDAVTAVDTEVSR